MYNIMNTVYIYIIIYIHIYTYYQKFIIFINLYFSKPTIFPPKILTFSPSGPSGRPIFTRPAAKKPRLDDGSAPVLAIAAAVEEEMPLPVEETVPVEVEAPEGSEKGNPKKEGSGGCQRGEAAVQFFVFLFFLFCWEKGCWK